MGRCLCGPTSYALSPPYDRIEVCHCIQCRRANGGEFHMVVPVTEQQVGWKSQNRISEYESSSGKFRAFCAGCGAPVYSRRTRRLGQLRLRAGLMPDLPRPSELKQQFGAYPLPWIEPLARTVARPEDEAI
ncbi:GFA family protein [Parapontixanthobacter aurantiacus]